MKTYPGICTYLQSGHELPAMVDVNCRRKNDSTHFHNYTQLCYVLAGKMEFRVDDEVRLLDAGSAVIIPPYKNHCLNTCVSEDTPITVMISFQDDFLTDRGYEFFSHIDEFANFERKKLPAFRIFSDEEKTRSNFLIREIIAEFSRHFDMSGDALAMLVADFFRLACTEDKEISDEKAYEYSRERALAISETIKYMALHYAEKITVEELCSIAAMSRSVYMECFKELTGLSPIKFLTQVRVYQARAMLVVSDMSISELANAVGFYDKSRLIHEFKEFFGVSPIAMKNAFPDSFYETHENSKMRWAWINESE